MAGAGSVVERASIRLRIEFVLNVRKQSVRLAETLSVEDQLVQSMPDASPTKWHLAHTTWFFETFVLRRFLLGYRVHCSDFELLFNSYYNSIGQQHPRSRRGMISRPSLSEVLEYREIVEAALQELEGEAVVGDAQELLILLELGAQHEQQHQELMLTDIKHVLFQNPSFPAYCQLSDAPFKMQPAQAETDAKWVRYDGGVRAVGAEPAGFHFDNEGPVHDVMLRDFYLSDQPLLVAHVLEFIEAGGYADPLLWLSEGWAWVQKCQVEHPLYYVRRKQGLSVFTHQGLQPLEAPQVACHLSFFEADALARFFGARLPTEFEWEHAAWTSLARMTNPPNSHEESSIPLMKSGVWEWTGSAYLAFPGYRPAAGAVGEYNGKFMHNQMVLRGRSWATPAGHERITYRNFFPGSSAWQFTGVRLAKDA